MSSVTMSLIYLPVSDLPVPELQSLINLSLIYMSPVNLSLIYLPVSDLPVPDLSVPNVAVPELHVLE
jgi:hypothetical protein